MTNKINCLGNKVPIEKCFCLFVCVGTVLMGFKIFFFIFFLLLEVIILDQWVLTNNLSYVLSHFRLHLTFAYIKINAHFTNYVHWSSD